MKRRLVGKRILVTGASSGIGYCLALQLAKRGVKVLGVARRAERLELLKEDWRTQKQDDIGILETMVADITIDSHRHGLLDRMETLWGGIDGLVNNAGAGAIGPFEVATPERLREVMEVDFFAPVEMTRIALPRLRKGNEPFVAIIGSVLAHQAVPNKSEYCAAKFALRGWSEALRVELRGSSVGVVMISPSTTRSEFFGALIGTSPEQRSRSLGAMEPQRVAALAIRAIERNRREVVLSLGGKALVASSRWLPGWLDRYL